MTPHTRSDDNDRIGSCDEMLMMWPSAPRQCVFCHCAGTVVPAVEIWAGAVVRCWRCQVCDRHWPLSPYEFATASGH